jgi:hypothetical protein
MHMHRRWCLHWRLLLQDRLLLLRLVNVPGYLMSMAQLPLCWRDMLHAVLHSTQVRPAVHGKYLQTLLHTLCSLLRSKRETHWHDHFWHAVMPTTTSPQVRGMHTSLHTSAAACSCITCSCCKQSHLVQPKFVCTSLPHNLNPPLTAQTTPAALPANLVTDDLSVHLAESAHVAAFHAAYTAQRQAQRVSTITDALATAVEASVQTAATSAQRCAHRQADRAAAFADVQAAAANQALQSLAGVLPGYVPPAADESDSNSNNRASGGAFAGASEFDPWANIGSPRNAAARGSSSSSASQTVAQRAPPATPTPAAAAAAALPVLRAQLQSSQAALSASEAAFADVEVQLAVKALTADIFRSVERRAAQEELQQLQQELQASRWVRVLSAVCV